MTTDTITQEEARAQGRHGWSLGRCDNGFHLIPVGDTADHMDEDCPCSPVRDELGLWNHNSFDGREAFEEGERKAS